MKIFNKLRFFICFQNFFQKKYPHAENFELSL